ncbi:hypothetical protein PG996_008261 [Apiospora saccharicola]|uniref:Peptidase S54 rhomboid domain-containing protein n=1 Tax=Apiospora saccharicola TaxID=335842 RepID=A0ABR1UXE2_9PEZI
MNVLCAFAPPVSNFQVGLRAALSSRPANLARTSSTLQRFVSSASRCFSTTQAFHHSPRLVANPSGVLRQSRLQCDRRLLPRTSVRTAFMFRAIVHYNQIPDSYTDTDGLPFRKEELNPREVKEIFGPHLRAPEANQLLRIIHGRRVAGTLDDPDLQQNTAQYSPSDKVIALDYLRKHIPVDEIVNAGLRAEDELRLLEEQEQYVETTEPEPESGKAAAKVEEPTQAPIGKLPRKTKSDSPYGESTIDRIRARNIAKQAAEERRLEEERAKREEEEQVVVGETRLSTKRNRPQYLATDTSQPQYLSAWRQKHAERAVSDLEYAPDKQMWELLLPAFAMSVLVLFAAYLATEMYKPPTRSMRLWPDIPPAAATCLGLILANVAVFALWKWPPAWAILNRYFVLSVAVPRPLQLIGAMFSHQNGLYHLLPNMAGLWFFGVRLHDEVGRANFLAIYFTSGTLGFLASLTSLVASSSLHITTLGASSAIWGVIAAYFWVHKDDEFKIFGYPPDPWKGPQGIIFLGLLLGLNLSALFSKKRATMDIPSHLGGFVAGAWGVDLVLKRIDDRARVRAEKLKTMGMLDKALEQKTGTKPVANDSPSAPVSTKS